MKQVWIVLAALMLLAFGSVSPGSSCARASSHAQPRGGRNTPKTLTRNAYGRAKRVQTCKSTGTNSMARPGSIFRSPYSLAVGRQGRVYVADSGLTCILKLSRSGSLLATWDMSSAMSRVNGVALDRHGNVYVWGGTSSDHVIELAPNGTPMRRWTFTWGRKPGEIEGILGLAIDATGNIYVADSFNYRIQKLSASGAPLAQWRGDGPFPINHPRAIALDLANNVYVADAGGHRVVKLSPEGHQLATWGAVGEGAGQFLAPTGIALDAAGNIYIVDALTSHVTILSPTGVVIGEWGSSGNGRGQLSCPTAIALDTAGNVYIAEERTANGGRSKVQEFSPTGQILAVWY